MRRRSFRRAFVRRPKARYQWVRAAINNVAPAAQNNYDVMTGFRAQLSTITGNLPDWVLMRFHLRINVQLTETAAHANNGVAVALWVDSVNQAIQSAQGRPYDQKFLIFDELYIGEAKMGGAVTPFFISRSYDVKSRRLMHGVNETTWLQLELVGSAVWSEYSFVLSALYKVP